MLLRNCGGVEPGNLKYLRCNGFSFADKVFSSKRHLLQAYSASQNGYRQFGPLQGLESWLRVHLMGTRPLKQGLQAAPRAVANVWNRSICKAALCGEEQCC